MNERRLQRMISSWIDGSISLEEKTELQVLLQDDSVARGIYLEHMSVHAELSGLESAFDYFESINNLGDYQCHNSSVPGRSLGGASESSIIRHRLALAIAASLLLASFLWQSRAFWTNEPTPDMSAVRILDAVGPISKNCDWYVEQEQRKHVNSYLAGDVIRVTKGKLELKYTHGTTVVLHAPAAYQLITGMKARMLLGRLTASVTEAAKGFSVLTPRATVVDLGTEFGVEVNNDGATDVVVFKGEVDVDYNDHTDQNSAQRLRMGEAVHLDAVGTASRIVSINGRSYADEELQSMSRPAVISAVHDNIERGSTLMSYYEIVHQGMQEDALAFVDRIAHEWNGINLDGMPDYLLGADYVKTFNSDKFNQHIKVSIQLDMPCKLYVFIDNRLPTPGWLRRDFRDTGDDIGMDTGPFLSTGEFWHNKGPSGIGAGKSVEDVFSIWVKEVSKPGVVFLGSTEAPISEPNMYGIAAAPLRTK